MQKAVVLLLCVASALAEPTIWFKETFEDEGWKDRWVASTQKGSEAADFKWSAGKFYGDPDKDKGIQTSVDARFYALSAKFPEAFSNEGKTLVVQFTVKHEQSIDCGGGYVKIFPSSLDQTKMHGDSPYNIMFGPDICGYSTKKVHVIFNYNGNNLLTTKDIKCKDDALTHLYTLILKPDNTYEVKIDNEKVESGSLEDDWGFLPPKEIPDPDAKKPEDWDDKPKIDDPEDKKPEDWDKPQHIPDPDAKKPEDWDDDLDGEWEPPQIDNPDYKGEWKPRQIDNPNYKGEWVHPKIQNPEYKPDANLYRYEDNAYIGFDLWQVKSGTIFDNVLITDDADYAKQFGDETWGKTKDPEKKMKDEQDEAERKQREEEDKKKKDEEGDGDDEDEDEEDEDEGAEDDEGEEGGSDEAPEGEEEEPTLEEGGEGDDSEEAPAKDEL
ncbi:calreticulin-like [Corticium candelabrum]|uniref:calreticulin-like n=1 Tax=Corticium candelabrum TaxID=121492 RepID=UPI002E2649FA|nr:calreticulin-like [Corticium candelabrum]